MRWLKSFLSPTTSTLRREYPPWLTLGFAVTLGSGAGRAVTPACGPNAAPQVLQLGRRAAKKLLLSQPKPSYPTLARINYIGGRVQLLVTVDCQGKVREIHVVRGHPFLAVAALNAIRGWVYHPFETATGPAGFQTVVDVNFSLIGPSLTTPNLPPDPAKFLARWIRPPEVVSPPQVHGADRSVRIRVLVSKKGRVVDSTPLSGTQAQFAAARKVVEHWRFHPARWGNLNVPWYMEITVPVE
jgi:TonB family protein